MCAGSSTFGAIPMSEAHIARQRVPFGPKEPGKWRVHAVNRTGRISTYPTRPERVVPSGNGLWY
jgi:hypothetical protein